MMEQELEVKQPTMFLYFNSPDYFQPHELEQKKDFNMNVYYSL